MSLSSDRRVDLRVTIAEESYLISRTVPAVADDRKSAALERGGLGECCRLFGLLRALKNSYLSIWFA